MVISARLTVLFVLMSMFTQCSEKKQNPENSLLGKWNRSDGSYTLDISEVNPDGNLGVVYLNPNPINVGRSGWKIEKEKVRIFVELRDENYPGSLYQLTLDEESGTLAGTYYQAVARQTFEVHFTRQKE